MTWLVFLSLLGSWWKWVKHSLLLLTTRTPRKTYLLRKPSRQLTGRKCFVPDSKQTHKNHKSKSQDIKVTTTPFCTRSWDTLECRRKKITSEVGTKPICMKASRSPAPRGIFWLAPCVKKCYHTFDFVYPAFCLGNETRRDALSPYETRHTPKLAGYIIFHPPLLSWACRCYTVALVSIILSHPLKRMPRSVLAGRKSRRRQGLRRAPGGWPK